MRRPAPRAQVHYKKPSLVNPVSIAVCALIGGLVYLGICYWPVLSLKSRAKSAMQEYLVQFYRLNLNHQKKRLTKDTEALLKGLRSALGVAGVADPNLQLKVDMNPKMVTLDLRFTSDFVLLGLDKRYPQDNHIYVETDAARVDW